MRQGAINSILTIALIGFILYGVSMGLSFSDCLPDPFKRVVTPVGFIIVILTIILPVRIGYKRIENLCNEVEQIEEEIIKKDELITQLKFQSDLKGDTTLEVASRPLIKYLNDNHNPHTMVIVSHTGSEVWEESQAIRVMDYLKD
jgi:hypothetical protein